MAQYFARLEKKHIGADQQRGQHGGVNTLAQFAIFLAGAQDLHQAREVLAEYLLGEFFAALRAVFQQVALDQSGDFFILQDVGQMQLREVAQAFDQSAGAVAELIDLTAGFIAGGFQYFQIKRVLRFEVMKDIGLADAGALRDGIHRYRVEARLGKQILGRSQDTLDRIRAGHRQVWGGFYQRHSRFR